MRRGRARREGRERDEKEADIGRRTLADAAVTKSLANRPCCCTGGCGMDVWGNTGKLIRAIGVYAMSPSLLPYYLIFWPGALPSTFDLPKHQEAKYLSHVAARVDGLLQGLSPLLPLAVRALLQQCSRAGDTCATGLMELERESTSEKNPVQAKEALALKTAGLKALSRFPSVCVVGPQVLVCPRTITKGFSLPACGCTGA